MGTVDDASLHLRIVVVLFVLFAVEMEATASPCLLAVSSVSGAG